MRANWLVALAAGAAIAMAAPPELAAQRNSSRAQQQQELQRQRQQAREAARRAADRRQATERDRLRRQREANRAGLVLRRNDSYDRAQRERDRRYDRYDRAQRDRDRRYDPRDIYDRGDIFGRRDDRYDARGPAFCRSGEGHPVKGRQWCRDKGFGLGRERSRDIWGDIIFRDRRYDDRMMSRSVLGNILGSVVLGRFDSYGRSYYGNAPLSGRWLDSRASVLQLYMGSVPIAWLIDTNRDGRVDNVSLLR